MTCCISAAKPKMLVDSQVSILTTSYFHLQRSGSSLVGFFCSGKAPYRLNGILLELKREGGEKERKSHMIYLVEKAQFSGGVTEGSSADLHQLKTGSILCLCSTALPRQLWPGWSRLHSVLSFQSTRAVSCLSLWEGQWLTCHDVDSGIPQSSQWRRDRQLSPHTRACDG